MNYLLLLALTEKLLELVEVMDQVAVKQPVRVIKDKMLVQAVELGQVSKGDKCHCTDVFLKEDLSTFLELSMRLLILKI
jgi:hypothetical protein